MAIKQVHQVVFFSPGTFVPEESSRPIDSWDVKKAVEMSREIVERYDAKPYGFQFVTLRTADPIDDGEGGTLKVQARELARSGTYFLGGKLRTYDEVRSQNKPDEDILRGNMRCNDIAILVENCNSWQFTGAFGEKDFLVSTASGEILERGDDPKHKSYRRNCIERMKAEREKAFV